MKVLLAIAGFIGTLAVAYGLWLGALGTFHWWLNKKRK
jgi:hypothetical protein